MIWAGGRPFVRRQLRGPVEELPDPSPALAAGAAVFRHGAIRVEWEIVRFHLCSRERRARLILPPSNTIGSRPRAEATPEVP